MSLADPLSYAKAGEERSLLGSVILGNGVVCQRPDVKGKLVLMDRARTVSSRITNPAVWQDYEGHLTTHYAGPEVRRHINKVITGGTPVVAWADGTSLHCDEAVLKPTYKASPTHMKSLTDEVWWALPSIYRNGSTDMNPLVDFVRNMLYARGVADDVWVIEAETVIPVGSTSSVDTWGLINGNSPYTPFSTANYYKIAGTAWSYPTAAVAEIAKYEPGICRVYLYLQEGSAAAPTTRRVILGVRTAPGFPYATLMFKTAYITSGNSDFIWLNGNCDFWVTVLQPEGTVPALATSGTHFSACGYTAGPSWAAYNDRGLERAWYRAGSYTATASVAMTSITQGALGFGVTYDANKHMIPGVAFQTHLGTIGWGVKMWDNGGDTGTDLAAALPGWPGIPIGNDYLREAIVGRIEHGRQGVLIGYDFSSNALAQLRYTLTGPLPPPSTPNMASSVKNIASLRSRWRSIDLLLTIESVELQSGQSLSGLKTDLQATPRDFQAFYDAAGFRIPVNVIYQTAVAITADDEGFDIDKEVFLPRDQDDPTSKDITFAIANKMCNDWNAKGTIKSIVLQNPTSLPAVSPITSGYSFRVIQGVGFGCFIPITETIEGVPTVTGYRPATDEEKLGVFLGIRGGIGPLADASVSASADYVAWAAAEPSNGYSKVSDYICWKEYGMLRYQITTNPQRGTSAREWTVDSCLDRGFLKHPSLWTPEVWAVTGAGKGYRAAGLVGSLLTNPFGFGNVDTYSHG